MDVKFEDQKEFNLVVKTKSFTEKTMHQIPAFWDEYISLEYHEKVCPRFGVLDTTIKKDTEEKTYSIGCEEENVSEVPKSFEVINIPTHTWAVFKVDETTPKAVKNKWNEIWSVWVRETDYIILDGYHIEYYPAENETSEGYDWEIWVPVKAQ